MKVLIIENSGSEALAPSLRLADESVEIVGTLHSIPEAVSYFNTRPQPDLLFFQTDPVLLPFKKLFSDAQVDCPVAYIISEDSAQKELLLNNSIAILTNPPLPGELKACLRHYREMQDFFMRHHSSLFEHFSGGERIRSRILIRKGTEYQTFRTTDIVYFFSEHKLVFLVDQEGRKYLSTARSLSDLMPQLDPDLFYRANRKFIVNVNFIHGFTRVPDGRFMLKLNQKMDEPIWISQPNTAGFRQWMGEKL